MRIQETLLLLCTLTWHHLASHLADGAKGKGIGESCANYDECGDYPVSFMRCVDNVCKCVDWQYYEPAKELCVSRVGQKCDAEAPRDEIKLEIKCGENAYCSPLPNDKFGRCRCAAGFRESHDGRCVPVASRWNSQTSTSTLPSHPKYGGGGSSNNKVATDQDERGGGARPDLDNRIVSFPYSSANHNSQSSYTYQSTTGALLMLALITASLLLIPSCFFTSFR